MITVTPNTSGLKFTGILPRQVPLKLTVPSAGGPDRNIIRVIGTYISFQHWHETR